MSDDMLDGAIRALREADPGRSAAADATRSRILGTARTRRRRRIVAARASAVLLCAALGGTAWAAATGRLPPLSALVQLLGEAPRTESAQGLANEPGHADAAATATASEPDHADGAATASEPGHADGTATASELGHADAAATAHDPDGNAAAVGAGDPAGRAAATAAGDRGGAPPAVAAHDSAGKAVATATTPAAGSGSRATAARGASSAAAGASAGKNAGDAAAEALYLKAHALHFQANDYAAARAAWEAYLAAAPAGRFAAFAHYNRALCLVRLGRIAEAKRALQPFASGAFGGYRKAEAQSLLDALGAGQP